MKLIYHIGTAEIHTLEQKSPVHVLFLLKNPKVQWLAFVSVWKLLLCDTLPVSDDSK